jgi:hypothetical protein
VNKISVIILLVLFFSCSSETKKQPADYGPKVTDAIGKVVPAETIEPPKIIVLDESTIIFGGSIVSAGTTFPIASVTLGP